MWDHRAPSPVFCLVIGGPYFSDVNIFFLPILDLYSFMLFALLSPFLYSLAQFFKGEICRKCALCSYKVCEFATENFTSSVQVRDCINRLTKHAKWIRRPPAGICSDLPTCILLAWLYQLKHLPAVTSVVAPHAITDTNCPIIFCTFWGLTVHCLSAGYSMKNAVLRFHANIWRKHFFTLLFVFSFLTATLCPSLPLLSLSLFLSLTFSFFLSSSISLSLSFPFSQGWQWLFESFIHGRYWPWKPVSFWNHRDPESYQKSDHRQQ